MQSRSSNDNDNQIKGSTSTREQLEALIMDLTEAEQAHVVAIATAYASATLDIAEAAPDLP